MLSNITRYLGSSKNKLQSKKPTSVTKIHFQGLLLVLRASVPVGTLRQRSAYWSLFLYFSSLCSLLAFLLQLLMNGNRFWTGLDKTVTTSPNSKGELVDTERSVHVDPGSYTTIFPLPQSVDLLFCLSKERVAALQTLRRSQLLGSL